MFEGADASEMGYEASAGSVFVSAEWLCGVVDEAAVRERGFGAEDDVVDDHWGQSVGWCVHGCASDEEDVVFEPADIYSLVRLLEICGCWHTSFLGPVGG